MIISDKNRLAGYYWVKYGGEWVIAEWTGNGEHYGVWMLCGDECVKITEEFEEVDEAKVDRQN